MDTKNDEDKANTKTIKPINKETVHKICSGQVVLSLAVAVKELVENSLDASATNIDIRLKNYGIDLIEVSDNGSGVTEDNFTALTLKYHTSKLSEYSDLLGVTSFGFRGEALSSLCSLAHLTITTRHKSSEYATKIEYDQKGNIVKKTPCSRQIGTTVSLTNLFFSLPVRQKEFHKNCKREFNKMTQLLYAYCLISLGVKITCSNSTNSNTKSLVVATQGSTSYKDNIGSVFGLKQMQSLLEINSEYVSNIKDNIFKGLSGEVEDVEESVNIEDVEIDLSEDSNDADSSQVSAPSSQKSQGYKNVASPIKFTGFISSCAHGSGRSSTDRQFYYINSRPCEPSKIIKLVNEIYRQYNPNQYPFVFLNINLERALVDVNVTPDKRKIFLTKEKHILEVLKMSVIKTFESIPRTLKIERLDITKRENDEVEAKLNQPRIFNSFIQQFANKYTSNSSSIDNDVKNTDLKRKSTTMFDYISTKTMKMQNKDLNDVSIEEDLNNSMKGDEQIESESEMETQKHTYLSKESSKIETHPIQDIHIKLETSNVHEGPKINKEDIECNFDIKMVKDYDEESRSLNCPENDSLREKNGDIMYLESTDKLPNTQIRNLTDVVTEKLHTINCKTKSINSKSNVATIDNKKISKSPKKVVTDKEDLGKFNRRSVNLKTSLEHVKALAKLYHSQEIKSITERVKFKTEINPAYNNKCEEELSREISKNSFIQMVVVGQFNLGFIITHLDDDLFIIDQHATDEIYNFETLQKTTELTNQKLVIPQQLELTGVNEQILMDNLEIFKKNGFTFEINKEALPTKRVKLLTIPMSKNWIFGKEDIEELLFMLRESSSEYCRPSRVRAMFASRACRKSVMIGTALSNADMKKLVDHMAEIDNPWNCPHGRPTIRHLVNLAMVSTNDRD